jgi:hypothetical protein
MEMGENGNGIAVGLDQPAMLTYRNGEAIYLPQ